MKMRLFVGDTFSVVDDELCDLLHYKSLRRKSASLKKALG